MVIDHKRITCIRCESTDVERLRERRPPLKMPDKTVRWYVRRCRACKQFFTTREIDRKP